MTFLQPNKSAGLANKILIMLAAGLVVGTFGMVALYNATVNADHNIAVAKSQLDAVGAEITNLNNTVVSSLSAAELQKIAAAGGLVAESKPQYFPISNDITLHAAYR